MPRFLMMGGSTVSARHKDPKFLFVPCQKIHLTLQRPQIHHTRSVGMVEQVKKRCDERAGWEGKPSEKVVELP